MDMTPTTAAAASPSTPDRLTGFIKNLNADGNFGFIAGPGNTDYFFHRTLVGTVVQFTDLRPGQRVSFSPYDHAKGKRARDLSPID